MVVVVVILAIVIAMTKPKWPNRAGLAHSAAAGFMVHGLYLGGVFVSIENGLSAGLAALIVSLQPVLTSTIANRWLGERVAARQWLGLALGLSASIWSLFEKTAVRRRDATRLVRGDRRRSSASPSERSIRNGSAAAWIGGRPC